MTPERWQQVDQLFHEALACEPAQRTARLAPNRPMGHALVLGIVGLVISIAGAASTWNKGPEFGPKWYPILLVLIALPCSWLGGKLFVRQMSR